MEVKQAYDLWAAQYDSDINKTRDLEAIALRDCLKEISFDYCLETGCGTGKNSGWLASRAKEVFAVDFSQEMLSIARQKISSGNIRFLQADITQPWNFNERRFDLITFSLVLEHIEHVVPVIQHAVKNLVAGGHIYIGELHPFKQYAGSKARFETPAGQHTVTCFTHHVSDFVQAAKAAGLTIKDVREYFDGNGRTGIPRILTLILKK